MLTNDDRAMLRDRPIIASVSGGKDSTAMALWLREQGQAFFPVFMDTGWEHADTYAYLDSLRQGLCSACEDALIGS
jgi:3'-phosphoadenosine 5'-phosphosulfate sulfotransferase (PAPS reductase)/FAD synthetase